MMGDSWPVSTRSVHAARADSSSGKTMNPDLVEWRLYQSAAEHACPEPRLQSYAQEVRPAEFDAYSREGLQC